MPEQNEKIISKYQGDKNPDERYLKLGRKITDAMGHKISGVTSDDPEYWGLREVLTPEMCDIANKMKLRQHYTFEQLLEMNRDYEAIDLQKILDEMAYIGILEYDYGDNYDHTHELKDRPRIRRYRLPFYVPGSAELFNSSVDRIAKNPAVASFFERMTFIPLAGITQMVPPGGDGIGMHVIPVEKAIDAESKSIDLEHISYWFKKYEGHISAGICSCRASRAVLGDGCTDDFDDWCIQLGDMADYTVETGRAHYITKERALEILELAEKNGYVHQITNIDGENKIFDICNCNVNVCNALRTSQLFNTPNLSRSAYVASVESESCVACGRCVENCPAGAVKLGQKLCTKDGYIEYPRQELPDDVKWGPEKWSVDYRDRNRINCYNTGTSPCKTACPAHIAVQGYLKFAAQGKYREALQLIKRENPFPAVCGRICNRRCEDACTRGTVDQAVAIDEVKRFIAQQDLNAETRFVPEKVIPKVDGEFSEKIAVIGGGPAGLSCAYYLAEKGYRPTVFEREARPGGMLMNGIPSFRIGKDVVKSEIDVLREMGVEFKCGVEVGKDITIQQLREEGYQAFYVAVGLQQASKLNIAGEDLTGVKSGLDFLREVNAGKLKKLTGDVVVIGGGNAAIDVARAALRLTKGSVNMYCLEKDEEMPTVPDEKNAGIADGVVINNSWAPKAILGEGGKVTGIELMRCVSVRDASGKFAPVYDENETITVPCSNVLVAIGQRSVYGDVLAGTAAETADGRLIAHDAVTFQSNEPDIFVGGDCATGPKYTIDAIATGREGAVSIHRFVNKGQTLTIHRNTREFKELNKDDIVLPTEKIKKPARAAVAIDSKKVRTMQDDRVTFTEEQIRSEASRCLSCGRSVVDPNKCIGCGICTTKCEFDAIHLKRVRPQNSKMIPAEDKFKAIAPYAAKRQVKIIKKSLTGKK